MTTATLRKGDEVRLTITAIAFGGRGLARHEGMAVFVAGAVPRDVVRARVVRRKKAFAEAVVVEILEASPFRVTAPCPFSGVCGGCTWQHLDYCQQLEAKGRFVAEALAHIGQIHDIAVQPAIASPEIFGYRNKMEFTFSDRRWLMPQEMGREGIERGMALGLHAPGTFDRVLDIAACLLQREAGNQILAEVRDFVSHSALPVYGLRSQAGFWRFLVLRHSVADDRWLVNIVTAAENSREVGALSGMLVDRHPQIGRVVNTIASRPASVALGEAEHTLYDSGPFCDGIGALRFEISANSFFQTNSRAAALLYAAVARHAALSGHETVLDLYSGTGTIPIYLASRAKRIVGIEINAGAVADAERNSRRNAIENCRFICGDIREVLPAMERPDVLIIDPPRSGMHPEVVRQVAAMQPERVVYVSCNPATLARDLALLTASYRVEDVQPVDMFPHTYHIEAVAQLVRRSCNEG